MDELQSMVAEFHRAMDHQIGSSPAMGDPGLRIALLKEECAETVDAMRSGDLPGAVDGLCDLIYVAVGAAVSMGVDLGPCFEAVHRANMAKAGGPVRADGKRLKPPGWTPPDIEGELRKQGWTP